MHLNNIKTEFLTHPDRSNPLLYFEDQTPVPLASQVKYLGSIISWKRPFDEAFKQRCGLAEEAYKKLRLVWNSSLSRKTKLHIFQSSFVPILTYGLDALTLTTPLLKRVDGFYYRFLRRRWCQGILLFQNHQPGGLEQSQPTPTPKRNPA